MGTLRPQLKQREWGEENHLPVLKNSPHTKAQIPFHFFHQKEVPFYLPPQTPPAKKKNLACWSWKPSPPSDLPKTTRFITKLWGLPDSQLWPPTPISESYLAGRGILFLNKQQSGAPVPWLPGQPITAACMLPSSLGDGAQRLLSGSGEDGR